MIKGLEARLGRELAGGGIGAEGLRAGKAGRTWWTCWTAWTDAKLDGLRRAAFLTGFGGKGLDRETD